MSSAFKPCVVIINGADLGKKFEVGEMSTFGRHSTCDVHITHDDRVSRRHMEVERVDDGWVIRDLNAMHGTFINDTQVVGEQVLADGDRILIGRTTLKFLCTSPPANADELVYLSNIDGLTGTWTKRVFLKQMEAAIEADEAVAMAMLDLVDFKDLNDYYGLQVADAVLRDFGRFLMELAGEDASVGRLGGEEFGVWMRGDLDMIKSVMWTIQLAMTEREFGAQETFPVRCWVGTAAREPGQSAIEIYKSADDDLDRRRTATREAGTVYDTMSPYVLFSENHPDELFELPFGEPRFGRSDACEITLKSRRIARSHARLKVTRDGVEIIDHNSTNGVYVNGVRIQPKEFGAVNGATLTLGDVFHIGEFSFELALAPWLIVDPPSDLIVSAHANADDAWGERQMPADDELWAAYYLRWRRLVVDSICKGEHHDDEDWHWPIAALARMGSPPLLQWIRDLLIEENNRAWFLGYRDLFIDAVAEAKHGIGPLCAHKIMREHPEEKAQDRARRGLLSLARQDGHTNVATAVFNRIPPEATSIAALVSPIFFHARKCQETWSAERFLTYLSRPSFAEASEGVVFALWTAPDELVATFRPSDGALLTLDDEVTLETHHVVSVAEAHQMAPNDIKMWEEHLADFEIVQPFEQFEA